MSLNFSYKQQEQQTSTRRKKEKEKKTNTHIKINVIYFDSLELDREYRRSFFFGDSAVFPLGPLRRLDGGGDCPRR
jgi:hypothetical protein